MARASALQLVDLEFISQGESYQKTLKNGIQGLPAWHSAQKVQCGEQAGKLACCALGKTLNEMSPSLCRTGVGAKQSTCRGGPAN